MGRKEKVPNAFISDKATKYTTNINDDGTVNSYYRFWSHEGIERFNDLRIMVKNNRRENPNFFQEVVNEWKKSQLDKEDAKKYNPMPMADDDYGDHSPGTRANIVTVAETPHVGDYDSEGSPGEGSPMKGRKLNMKDANMGDQQCDQV